MSLVEVLQTLRDSGVTLALEGREGLRIHAPRGAMTPALRELLRGHKDLLLDLLREDTQGSEAPLPVCTPDPDRLHEPFDLSDLQMGFYMAADPYMEFHVRPHYYIEKDGPAFDPRAYEEAWHRALQRHDKEIVIVRSDGRLQTVADPERLPVRVHDWRHLEPDAARAAMHGLRAAMMRAELPIDRWPWLDLRVSLWHDGSRECARIHYNHNNFFSDGYGTTRLLQEVDRYMADPATRLPPLSLAFRDAALALEQLAETEAGQQSRRYWEDRLPALPAPVPLPLKPGMNRRCRSQLQRREGWLAANDWARLKQHGRDAGLTPSSALFAVYAELLAHWSNSRHFVLSNMMTRRLPVHPEVREIIGNFASLYPLEVDLRGCASFREGAVRLQEQVLRDSRHTLWGGMKVMQSLSRLGGELGGAVVPYVIGSGLFMEGFECSDYSCLETSQVLLDHQFWELADGRLYYVWDAQEPFFPDGLLDDMASAYDALLQALAADEVAWSGPAPLRLPERQRLQREQPDTAAPGQPLPLLCDGLPAAARDHAGRPAVRCGLQTLDYAALQAAADGVATRLRACGVQPGDRVAVVTDRGADWLAAVHGVQRVGAAHVPIDPAMPMARLAVMLADSGAAVLLTQPHQQNRDWPQGLRVLDVDLQVAAPPAAMPVGLSASSLAYLIYTSGSTGQPKGVMIDHQGVVNTVLTINAMFAVGPTDRLLGVSSIGFDLSVYDVFGAAAAGACVIYPDPALALNPSHWLALMAAEGVTLWNSAPALAVLLADAAGQAGVQLPALRLVMLSGDWIPLDLPDRLRAVAPNARVVSLGGATEASIWSVFHEIEAVDPTWPSIPYGRALARQSLHVLDEQGRDLPEWVAGELCIGGIGLAQGYWGDPQRTAAAFIRRPGSDQRLYRTGDVARFLPGGVVEFLGRRDAQVKVQGYRIELGEIEAALALQPDIATAVVLGRKASATGPVRLVAYVVPAPGARPDAAGLAARLLLRLPRYMVPAQFVMLERLPLSPNGKVDRRALPEPQSQTADARSASAARVLRPPRDAIESRLLALWSRVLGRTVTEVGHDFFDDLGGQSFDAVRLVGLITETWGTRLSMGDLWQHRDIPSQLALVQQSPASARQAGSLRTLSTAGGGMSLALVHPGGGGVLAYRHLAAQMQRPVYAFEAATLRGAALPASVPALADRYARELVEQNLDGPLLLGGWSSGGPVAWALAQQLRDRGRDVRGVVIIDSPAPTPTPRVPPSRGQLLAWFIEDLAWPAEATALAQVACPPLQDSVATADDHAATLSVLAAALAARGLPQADDLKQLAPVYRCFETLVLANAAYVGQPMDIDVLLLRAADGHVGEFAGHPAYAQPDWDWQRLSSRPVQVRWMPGSHHTLLLADKAANPARAIEDWLAGKGSHAITFPTHFQA